MTEMRMSYRSFDNPGNPREGKTVYVHSHELDLIENVELREALREQREHQDSSFSDAIFIYADFATDALASICVYSYPKKPIDLEKL